MTRLPASLPASWLIPEIAGHSVRIVESLFDPDTFEARLRAALPDAAQITVTPLSLRDIFLALARTYRLNNSTEIK